MAGTKKIHLENSEEMSTSFSLSIFIDNLFRDVVPLRKTNIDWIILHLTVVHTRDFGFGKASMEELINEEVKMFVEEVPHDQDHDAAAADDDDGGDDNNDQVKKNAGEPFDFISKFNLPVVNALWNVTAGHRFEYNDPKLISMIQVKLRYTNDDDDADDIVETD